MRRLLFVLIALSACADEGPESPPVIAQEATLSPNRALARAANNHLVNYGPWSADQIAVAQAHDVVVVYPNASGIDRNLIATLQTGGAHRVLVLCYLSVGEDLRTASLTDAQMAADPRFRGDGTGPRMDPRGPAADGQSLAGVAPLGLPSNGGTGWASWYLDDVSVHESPSHIGDGFPDRNHVFHSAFVNAGDPKWFDALSNETLDGPDKLAGLREIMTTTTGRGLGCDGVFLDTIDTAAPNRWTSSASPNETKFEWTAPGFAAFIGRVRAAYPDAVIAQNRGLFFFNPWNPQYPFIPRGNLDFLYFESYRLNSSSTNNPDPYFYPDNRYNFAPKLMAEADRSDGFRVLSIGYAEGPNMSHDTLTGGSTLGYDSLLEDIRVTERLAGFRHYLTDAKVTLINRFVLDHADRSDSEAPVWTSTWNDGPGYPNTPTEATPRVGVQQVIASPGALTVRWDVAEDYSRVRYALYYQTQPFDFGNLATATRVVLDGRPTSAYQTAVGPGIYANEATVTGLTPGVTYYLLLRAFDDSPAANEDGNQVVLTGVPTGAATYLGRLRASNTASTITYRFTSTGTWAYRRVYVDTDRMPGTGWQQYGIGADLLVENGNLFRYTGDGQTWSWTWVKGVPFTPTATDARWDLALADVGATRDTNLVFQLGSSTQAVTSAPYEHVYTTTDPASPYSGYYVENDGSNVFLHAEIQQPFSYEHVFIDDDANPATGYAVGGVGAGWLIENGSLYRWIGPGWTWSFAGSASHIVAGAANDWTLPRSTVGGLRWNVVYQANGGSPTFVAPVYAHPFTP